MQLAISSVPICQRITELSEKASTKVVISVDGADTCRSQHPAEPWTFLDDNRPDPAPRCLNAGAYAGSAASDDKNAAQKRLFRSLRAKGEKRIYYIPSSSLMRSEDTVDGIHPTDLGMEHYAEAYARILKKIL